MKRYNSCFTMAIYHWLKKYKQRRYLLIRKSDLGWFPHFLWTDNPGEDVYSWSPINPEKRIFPPIFFKGYIKRGDKDDLG